MELKVTRDFQVHTAVREKQVQSRVSWRIRKTTLRRESVLKGVTRVKIGWYLWEKPKVIGFGDGNPHTRRCGKKKKKVTKVKFF